jgi:hypothetical protein
VLIDPIETHYLKSSSKVGHKTYLFHARITAVSGFSSEAISAWAREPLAAGSQVLSDVLARFRAVTTAGCSHQAIVTVRKLPFVLPQFRWINTLLGNLKASFNGTFHAFTFGKYAPATTVATVSASAGTSPWRR